GSGTYTYPLTVPPGTNGLQPSLALVYSSQHMKDSPSIAGTGWVLAEDYIERDEKYTLSDSNDDEFDLYIGGEKYDLVYDNQEQRYHTKRESYMYIQKLNGNSEGREYWVVKTKDGMVYRFGYNADSELRAGDLTARWSVDLVTDTHDNNIYYLYEEHEDGGSAIVYPSQISYNNDQKRVIEFFYENGDQPGYGMKYKHGVRASPRKRITEVRVLYDQEIVRKYTLQYVSLGATAKETIGSITEYGQGGIQSKPPVRFEYEAFDQVWGDGGGAPTPFVDREVDLGVRFGDFNGDGIVDAIQDRWVDNQQRESHLWFGVAGGGWQQQNWNLPWPFTNSDGSDRGLRVADVNGDHFDDLVLGGDNVNANVWWVWLNNGQSFVLEQNQWRQPSPAANFIIGFESNGVEIIDVNGDGLDDLVRGYEDHNPARETWINTGSGWVVDETWRLPNEDVYFLDEDGQDTGLRFVDLNGDGLIDLLQSRQNDDNRNRAYLNTGNGWRRDDTWLLPNRGRDNMAFLSGNRHDGWRDAGVRFMDINNDGLTDIVKAFDEYPKRTYLNTGHGWQENNNLLIPDRFSFIDEATGRNKGTRSVDVNGDGAVDLLRADRNEDMAKVHRSPKAYLLKRVVTDFGGSITLEYSPSTTLNNQREDGLPGMPFNLWVVSRTTADNGMDVEHNTLLEEQVSYEKGQYDSASKEFRGFGYATENRGNEITVKHWYHQDYAKNGKEFKTRIEDANNNARQETEWTWNSEENNNIFMVTLDREDVKNYDGNVWTSRIDYEYDDYGNVAGTIERGDINVRGDERFTHREYVYDENDWIVDTVKREWVNRDDDRTKVKETKYSYDGRRYGQSPTQGDITRIEQWNNQMDSIIEHRSYDNFGMTETETDGNGHVTRYGYEDTHTFPLRITNAKGQPTEYSYDLATGNILSTTDPNGFITAFEYDDFARITKEIRPLDSSQSPTKTYIYSFDGSAPEHIVEWQKDQHDGRSIIYVYDGFGKFIQQRKSTDAQQVALNIFYDPFDRVRKVNNPAFENSVNGYQQPAVNILATTFTYDS
ncbi:MAG: toxin TcdB middle/N-terminal domain-containing protein, partial [Nanoarchaeota archaeon]